MQDTQNSKRTTKRFTIAEANAMLPLVKSIAADICQIFKRVTGRRADLHRLLRRGARHSGSQYDDEMAESRADLQEEYDQIWQYREELESLGLLLRQPEDGAIEFPSRIDEHDVYLCWQLGEDSVQYYRDASTPNSPKHRLPSFEKAR